MAVWSTALRTLGFLHLCATLCYFCYFCYFCLLFANIHSQMHTPIANLCPIARARCRSTFETCGGGCVGYSCPHPGLLATLCNFLLLLLLSATFCYFCLLFANTHSRMHSPTANLCSICTHLAPEHPRHVWGWPCGIQLPTPRASCSFVKLCATFAYFCLLYANIYSQTHPHTANLCSSYTRTPPEQLCHVWGWPCGIQLPTPRLRATLCNPFATFCYFCLLMPTFRQYPQP